VYTAGQKLFERLAAEKVKPNGIQFHLGRILDAFDELAHVSSILTNSVTLPIAIENIMREKAASAHEEQELAGLLWDGFDCERAEARKAQLEAPASSAGTDYGYDNPPVTKSEQE
jgi:hypothetical protein